MSDVARLCATGIGKSIFNAYFFKRYSDASSDEWVLLASFDADSNATRVVSKRGGVVNEEEDPAKTSSLIVEAMKAADTAGERLLLLLDGPPESLSLFRALSGKRQPWRMVCFTGPNTLWQAVNLVHGEGTTLYMPPWTIKELGVACMKLGLDMDDDELENRFYVYGGDARMCLHPDSDFVKREEEALRAKIAGITTVDAIQQVLLSPAFNSKRDGLIHFEPDERATHYSWNIASRFVKIELMKNMFQLAESDRAELFESFRSLYEARVPE